jgi:soluble lytic murein transglycosylase-like protein
VKKITPRNLLFPSLIVAVALLVTFTQILSTPTTAWANTNNTSPSLLKIESEHKYRLSDYFPPAIQQWKLEIEQQSDITGIDANIIASVILIESGGDAMAYSSCGAVGLMQVMPRDGLAASFSCNGQPCFTTRPSMSELFDPRFNIEFGTSLLKNLFAINGNWRAALYSYGPIDVGYNYADQVLAILDQYSQGL